MTVEQGRHARTGDEVYRSASGTISRADARRDVLDRLRGANRELELLHRPGARPRARAGQIEHGRTLLAAYRTLADVAAEASGFFRPDSATELSLLALANSSTRHAERVERELSAAIGGA